MHTKCLLHRHDATKYIRKNVSTLYMLHHVELVSLFTVKLEITD